MPEQRSITTVERHFLDRKSPHANPEFSWLLSGITLATKIIAAEIHRAGLVDIMGKTARTTVEAEECQKLAAFANPTLVRSLVYRGSARAWRWRSRRASGPPR